MAAKERYEKSLVGVGLGLCELGALGAREFLIVVLSNISEDRI
jgi:hypothetical protein